MAVINGTEGSDNLVGAGDADTISGLAGDDILDGLGGADVLNGGDGIDRANYWSSSAAVSVDLSSGIGSGGDAAGDVLTDVENLLGSFFNDVLIGNASDNYLQNLDGDDIMAGGLGNDVLIGGLGADALDGGDGSDWADYSTNDGQIRVVVGLTTGTMLDGAAGDTLANIENLRGTAFDDELEGNAGVNILDGQDGNDTLWDRAGGDTMIGGNGIDTVNYVHSTGGVTVDLGAGTGTGAFAEGDTLTGIENLNGSAFGDRLSGDAGANVINGSAGDDYLQGGAGADSLTGGDGVDWTDYWDSTVGVSVNLATGTGSGGEAAGDTFSGIENIAGSNLNDRLAGDAGVNRLNGRDGADSLNGGAGNDQLVGGAGADALTGGAGFDSALYDNASSGVTASLTTPSANTGDAAGDIYSGIENLTGSAFADTLTGNGASNYLIGLNGDDILNGAGGADTLAGGAGADTFVFRAVASTSATAPDRIVDFSQSQGDTIDLSGITHGDGSFIGTAAFSGTAGEVRILVGTTQTAVYVDADGDGAADAQVRLFTAVTLTADDFVL